MFCLASDGDVFSRLAFQVFAVIPINCHIFDELKSIGKTHIIFRKIRCHLQRTVHGTIKRELISQRAIYMRVIAGIYFAYIHLKNAGGIIHGAAQQPGERQNGNVIGFGTAECLVFCTSSDSFPISWPGACKSGWPDCFMRIDHHMI